MRTLNLILIFVFAALTHSAHGEILATLFPTQGADNPPKALWNRVLLDGRV